MDKGAWIISVAAVLAWAMLASTLERQPSEVVTAKHERAAYERKTDLTPQERVSLSCPVAAFACDATVTAKYYDHQQPCPACYFRKEAP